jgi:hypothetical protein
VTGEPLSTGASQLITTPSLRLDVVVTRGGSAIKAQYNAYASDKSE